MPIDESFASGRDPAARVAVAQLSAHLRLTPRTPQQYQVVLIHRGDDGRLSEVVLTPLEASVLVSEIAQALEEGDGQICQPEWEQTSKQIADQNLGDPDSGNEEGQMAIRSKFRRSALPNSS